MIITWTCKFCGWNNDNNDGPCRRCKAQTEMRLSGGHWKEFTITPPRPQSEWKGYTSDEEGA